MDGFPFAFNALVVMNVRGMVPRLASAEHFEAQPEKSLLVFVCQFRQGHGLMDTVLVHPGCIFQVSYGKLP